MSRYHRVRHEVPRYIKLFRLGDISKEERVREKFGPYNVGVTHVRPGRWVWSPLCSGTAYWWPLGSVGAGYSRWASLGSPLSGSEAGGSAVYEDVHPGECIVQCEGTGRSKLIKAEEETPVLTMYCSRLVGSENEGCMLEKSLGVGAAVKRFDRAGSSLFHHSAGVNGDPGILYFVLDRGETDEPAFLLVCPGATPEELQKWSLIELHPGDIIMMSPGACHRLMNVTVVLFSAGSLLNDVGQLFGSACGDSSPFGWEHTRHGDQQPDWSALVRVVNP